MTDQPTERESVVYDAIDAFQRTHRLPGLQHAQIRGLLAEHLARVLPAAFADLEPVVTVSSPPPDQTLRDRIASAVQDGPTWMLPRSLAEEVADAVLAVLPPPADRAAVLREAADRYAQLVDENEAYDREHGQLDETARVQHGAVRDVVVGLRRLAAEAPQQESGSGCAHCVCCHAWGDREAHAALVRDDGADARQPETCRNCQGSGLDPRYNGEYACPDCSAEAPQPEEEAELVCVDECGFCDACGMEPFGTPAEGWREAARFLRRTPRDSTDFSGALRGARLIEDELRRRAEAPQPDTETPFVTRVLELFSLSHADAYGDLFWRVEKGQVRLYANVSDVFAWGGADAEEITLDKLPALEQAYADLKAIDINATEFMAELYAARQRGQRPQGAAYPTSTHDHWRQVSALYDACGPERELGLGNPKPAPAHQPAVPVQPAADGSGEETCDVAPRCDSFPDNCPNLRAKLPDPGGYALAVRCGCYDEEPQP